MEACRVSTCLGKLRVDLEPDCGEDVEASGFYPMFSVSFFFRERPGRLAKMTTDSGELKVRRSPSSLWRYNLHTLCAQMRVASVVMQRPCPQHWIIVPPRSAGSAANESTCVLQAPQGRSCRACRTDHAGGRANEAKSAK